MRLLHLAVIHGRATFLRMICTLYLFKTFAEYNFEFLTTRGDKGYHIFLETLAPLLYFYL